MLLGASFDAQESCHNSLPLTLMRSRGAKAVLATAAEPPAVAKCIEYTLSVSKVVADQDS